MRERATTSRSVDEIYRSATAACRRFGVSRLRGGTKNGRQIWYPADWDEAKRSAEHRDRSEARERRLAEIERTL